MKKNSSAQAAAPADTRQMPMHDEISRQARELWEKYGRPSGHDQEIWLEAERQLLGTDQKARRVSAGAVSAPQYAARAG